MKKSTIISISLLLGILFIIGLTGITWSSFNLYKYYSKCEVQPPQNVKVYYSSERKTNE